MEIIIIVIQAYSHLRDEPQMEIYQFNDFIKQIH